MMHKNTKQTGFTIVELTIAMAFVTVLLLAIAMTAMRIAGIYNKGLTMKAVNQSGREVIVDMKRTISDSKMFSVPYGGDVTSSTSTYGKIAPLILQDSSGDPKQTGEVRDNHGGRFCTGTYTYVWNTGRYSTGGTHVNKYANDPAKVPRLVKVRDTESKYCTNPRLDLQNSDDPKELLSEGELAVQMFKIEQVSGNLSVNETLYRISIKLSNANVDALTLTATDGNIDTIGECRPPSAGTGLENFCAVNEFVFTARAGNIGG